MAKRILTDGYETNVEIRGSGPPMLLLHGWCDSHRTFDDVLPALAEHHTVYAPDFKGHGWSDKPDAPYALGELVGQIEALVLADGLDDVTIVGNSLGGLVAVRFALRRPERVRALCLLNAAASPDAWRIRGLLGLGAMPVVGPIFARTATAALIPASLRGNVGDPSLVTRERCAIYAEVLRLPGYRRAVGRIGRWVDRGKVTDEELRSIRVPTTIVWGELDRVTPPRLGRHLRDTIPGAKYLELPGIAHLPQIECPDVVVREALALGAGTDGVRESAAS